MGERKGRVLQAGHGAWIAHSGSSQRQDQAGSLLVGEPSFLATRPSALLFDSILVLPPERKFWIFFKSTEGSTNYIAWLASHFLF